MKIVSIDHIEPGAILGKTVYSEYCDMLLAKGVVLTESFIRKLRNSLVEYVYIDDEETKDIEIKSVVSEQIQVQAISKIKNVMKESKYLAVKNSGKTTLSTNHFNEVKNVIKSIIESIEENKNVKYIMAELMGADMYTYKHCINVAILSILTAKALKYDMKKIEDIAMGAILHDIGKAFVDDKLINSRDCLTHDEFIKVKEHSRLGYEILKDDLNVSAYTKQITYMHHERLDGTGYPNGFKGDQIPQHVRIVSLCDMFDAITSDRVYRKRMPIYKALEIIMTEVTTKLDLSVYQAFSDNIIIYPPGTGVILDDGRKGVVVDYRNSLPTRPVVRILDKEKGPYEIDLMKELTTFIKDTVDY